MTTIIRTAGLFAMSLLAVVSVFASNSLAQSSSLYQKGSQYAAVAAMGEAATGSQYAVPRNVVTMRQGSWIYRENKEPPIIKKHDLITIRVDEKQQMLAEGDSERRQTAKYDAQLKDWILLKGLSARPDPQSYGDPKIKADLSTQSRTESDVETLESVTFVVTAVVADIRPNGLLVLEAHKVIQNNEEQWECRLAGICRREDIGPDNTVMSEDIADLRIEKRESGAIRDAYKRGWFTRWFDQFNPF